MESICKRYITPEDIINSDPKLNLLQLAVMFNAKTGLPPPTEEEMSETAKLLSEDAEDSRLERGFRMWLNSLGWIMVNNIYEDVRDGLILLKLIDRVEPGIVD